MDTITHALLGTAIAEVGFRSKLGKRALIAGAVFGTLPDSDMFLVIADPKHMLNYHRAATHSIVLAFIAAPLLGWLAWKFGKKRGNVLNWTLLALLTVLSHDFLDLFTSWGTEILYPINNIRYAFSALPIVDPLIMLPLLSVLVCAIFLKSLKFRRILATTVLLWCAAYTATGYTLSQKAIKLVEEQKPAGFESAQSQAVASIGTILLWHVALKDKDNHFFTAEVKSLKNEVFNSEYLTSTHDKQINNILNDSQFEIYRRASRDMLLFQKDNNNTNRVIFRDMRYSVLDPNGNSLPLFWTEVQLTPKGGIKDIQRQRTKPAEMGGFSLYLDKIFN